MTHNRTAIRHGFKALLDAVIVAKIEIGQAHKFSDFPALNITSGGEVIDIETYASGSAAREYELQVEVFVSSNDHEDQIDTFIKKIESVISNNRINSDIWNFAFVTEITEPQSAAGDTNYSSAIVKITFQYEG